MATADDTRKDQALTSPPRIIPTRLVHPLTGTIAPGHRDAAWRCGLSLRGHLPSPSRTCHYEQMRHFFSLRW